MRDALLRLYHRLPAPAQNVAATARGWQLRAWRYGPETEGLAAEALERETWSAQRWSAWQEERLARVLHRAATRVPYYREQWSARRRAGDRRSWERLDHWPVLAKDAVRAWPEAFVADDCDVRRMYPEHTSGTTGQPLRLWWSRDTVRAWYALFEARWRRWYGVSRRDRWAILGGQLVAPVRRQSPPFWVWNGALRQLYLSSYHLAPALLPHYLQALVRYDVRYLWGYTSALVSLADGAAQAGVPLPRLAVVISNAEPLDAADRRLIGAALGCPVRETYGMAEVVTAASECEHGALHLWPEVGVVEVRDGAGDGEPVADGVPGALVCTGLLNEDMPLVRYTVGDRGALAPPGVGACACGRGLPRLASVEGRADDVLFTRDGRRVGRLDPVFKAELPISAAQIVQERLDRVRVRYVPAGHFGTPHEEALRRRLRERLGDVAVVLEPTDSLPRAANGKVRAVICELPPGERPS